MQKFIVRSTITHTGIGLDTHIDASTGKTVKIENINRRTGRILDVQHIDPDTGHRTSQVYFDPSTGEIQKVAHFDRRSGKTAWVEYFDVTTGSRTRVEQIEQGSSSEHTCSEVLRERLEELEVLEMVVFHEGEILQVNLASRRVLERVRTRLYHELQRLVVDIYRRHPAVVRQLDARKRLSRLRQPLKGA